MPRLNFFIRKYPIQASPISLIRPTHSKPPITFQPHHPSMHLARAFVPFFWKSHHLPTFADLVRAFLPAFQPSHHLPNSPFLNPSCPRLPPRNPHVIHCGTSTQLVGGIRAHPIICFRLFQFGKESSTSSFRCDDNVQSSMWYCEKKGMMVDRNDVIWFETVGQESIDNRVLINRKWV